jgi:hypothetical protein
MPGPFVCEYIRGNPLLKGPPLVLEKDQLCWNVIARNCPARRRGVCNDALGQMQSYVTPVPVEKRLRLNVHSTCLSRREVPILPSPARTVGQRQASE